MKFYLQEIVGTGPDQGPRELWEPVVALGMVTWVGVHFVGFRDWEQRH